MAEFLPFIKRIQTIPTVLRIIPGKISRQQSGSSFLGVTISYGTTSGIKYMMKKWWTAQELFITCAEQDKDAIIETIQHMITQHLV